MFANNVSAFLMALSRSDVNVVRMSDKYSSHPVAEIPHSEKYLLKLSSVSHARQSGPQRAASTIHARISVWHDVALAVFVLDANDAAYWALTPAARHDCSIKLSYVSDTSSAVQPSTLAIHCSVAHT